MGFKAALPYRPIELTKFGGLYLEADPRNLPKGASPLCYDVDFQIAKVGLRPAIQNAIQFGSANASAYAGAASQTGTGAAWQNLPNVIGPPDGHYATFESSETGSISASPETAIGPVWTNPAYLYSSPPNYASISLSVNQIAPELFGYGMLLSIPVGASITGIEVSLDGYNSVAGGSIEVALGYANFSPHGGLTFSQFAGSTTESANLGSSSAPLNFGSSSYLWDTSWSGSDFTAFFAVGIAATAGSSATEIFLSGLTCTVYYTLPGSSELLIASSFGFAVPGGAAISGIEVQPTGHQSGTGTLTVQLYNGGIVGNPKPVPFTGTDSSPVLGGNTDSWGAMLSATIVNSTEFGVTFFATATDQETFYVDACKVTVYLSSSAAPGETYVKTFYCPGQGPLTLALDTSGILWEEEVDSSPGVMNSVNPSILPNLRAMSNTVNGREFIAFSDFQSVCDQPRQYDGTNLDRISQVGPGAGPQIAVDTAQYPIAASPYGLTQPYAQVAIWRVAWGAVVGRDNVKTPGTILTMFGAPGVTTFTTELNIGDTVYLTGIPLMGTNLPSGSGQNPNGTYVVTSIGLYEGSGGASQYFTVTAPESQGVLGPEALSGAYYQKTIGLIQLLNPIPAENVAVGGNLTISGAGNTKWDETWTVIGTPTEGQLLINSTSLTSDIATYGYSLVSGQAPGWQPSTVEELGAQIVGPNGGLWQVTTPGTTGGSIPSFTSSPQTDNTVVWTEVTGNMFVTVFNTDNGSGIFNVSNAVILTANQTTFTVGINSPNISSAAEEGEAISGQGTVFEIDPGLATLGTGNPGTDPILGNSGGGQAVVAGQIGAGQRYVICMFLTRNGFITPASPPVPFYTSESSVSFRFSNVPIGGPDVIARIMAVTAPVPAGNQPSNANIGGPYYWIPEDVKVQDLATGQTVTYNKTVISDNTSSESGQITFSDVVLLSEQANNVTQQGNNTLQMRELGAHIFNINYAGRMFYGGEQTKIDNLLNMTFDGGYLPSAPGLPAGWNVAQSLIPLVSLRTPSVGGNSLYILNSTGSIFNGSGTPAALSQGAYEDAFSAPIIDPNTAYSVRIYGRVPSGVTTGSFVVSLESVMGTWSYTLPFSLMSENFAYYSGPLNNPLWQSVPSDLTLNIYPLNLQINGDVEIKRIEIFPTNQPTYSTSLGASYVDNYEAIDGVTGPIDFSEYNNQPVRAAFRLFDTLYICKSSSMSSTQDNGSTEPAGWGERLVSNSVGALGPLAVDATDNTTSGEDYALIADRKGLYIFDGARPIKISQEIQKIWDMIVPSAYHTIVVKNDVAEKRILVAVPIPTPNQWLPKAPVNSSPSSPNVILMCSYLGIETPAELAGAAPVHVSMFTGSLLVRDMTRKWTVWQIPTNCASWISREDGSKQLWFGGAVGTGKLYALTPGATNDDGMPIQERYVTFDFSDNLTEQEAALGSVRKLYSYASILADGSGGLEITTYPESLTSPYPVTQPAFTLQENADHNLNMPMNVTGNRVFVDFETDGESGSYFNLYELTLFASPDPRIPTGGL